MTSNRLNRLNCLGSTPGVNENITLDSVALSKVIQEDVLLMKVDVEGWEWSVMKGAGEMLRQYKVENIIMEYSPGAALEKKLIFQNFFAIPSSSCGSIF